MMPKRTVLMSLSFPTTMDEWTLHLQPELVQREKQTHGEVIGGMGLTEPFCARIPSINRAALS
jgi:hypothetical protein